MGTIFHSISPAHDRPFIWLDCYFLLLRYTIKYKSIFSSYNNYFFCSGQERFWMSPMDCSGDQWCWDGVSGNVGGLEQRDRKSCDSHVCGYVHKKDANDWHWHTLCCSETKHFICEKGGLPSKEILATALLNHYNHFPPALF